MEQTPDAYASELVEVFRCVRDVLADDGTLWLNIGDSYAAQRGGTEMPAETLAGGVGGKAANLEAYRGRGFSPKTLAEQESAPIRNKPVAHRNAKAFGLKHKDLIGIPWMLAFALRADGWYLRQDIIWHKPNPMPESVRDRCTKAHEYIFLLSKSQRYYYDNEAVAEPAKDWTTGGPGTGIQETHHYAPTNGGNAGLKNIAERYKNGDAPTTRNRRSVWTVETRPFKGAHFATFPPALIEPCILAGCPKGGAVLDPFGGAGTTGLVADRLGRNAVLVELNAEYAEMAQRRISNDAGMFAEVSA